MIFFFCIEIAVAFVAGWNSNWEFVFAAIGSAIGLGNIVRFPYLAYTCAGRAAARALRLAGRTLQPCLRFFPRFIILLCVFQLIATKYLFYVYS